MRMVTVDSTTSVESLRSRLRGEVITPADAAYDRARRVWNAMIDKRPLLVVA